jgi:steroid 5-alpha reductase family enzyme
MLRERHVIDTFKGLTGPFVLGTMAVTGRTASASLWVYLAIHGIYGVLWVMKSRVFGDKNWERELTPKRFVMLVSGLSAYWAAPVCLALSGEEASPPLLALAVALFGFGVFLHFASDMQKHMWIEHKRGNLLESGLWARTRNPNYLGELCIYLSFATLSLHWLPFVFFGSVIAIEWVPNMRRKDASLSRYPAFAAYKARSGLLFPKLF